MSAQPKYKQENFYSEVESNSRNKKVNLTDLVERMKDEEKKEKKNNLILSAAAVSAVAVFGIILTL